MEPDRKAVSTSQDVTYSIVFTTQNIFDHCRGVAMMRLSSTYHLYKIALLVKTADVAKDSVILRSGQMSTALYFIVSGTVEVIQVKSIPLNAIPIVENTTMSGKNVTSTGFGRDCFSTCVQRETSIER